MAPKNIIAQTPPMGWNSWDCFGASVNEDEVRANAQYVATHMKDAGWEYVVVDIQWYEPTADCTVYHPFADLCMDEYGRLMPATNRFPSAKDGRGFTSLGEYIHSLGLKFGIHIMRGIPRQAVAQNTPIKNSTNTARDIAHPYSICPWNTDMYGVQSDKPGAQAYYDSLLELYASWGVDFIKVDDISYTWFGEDTYAGAPEIEMIHQAIAHCGRDIVLSLSCGPAPIEHAQHLSTYSNMWRLTADLWDRWDDIHSMFDTCAKWVPYGKPGHWPDADMLPLGHIVLRGAEHGASDRRCLLTRHEQQTMMTLWCMARSPLMVGAHLPDNDPETLALLTNKEVLAVNQQGQNPRQLMHRGYQNQFIAWLSSNENGTYYIAMFNTSCKDANFALDLTAIHLTEEYALRDLWEKKDCGSVSGMLEARLSTHGCKLYALTPIKK